MPLATRFDPHQHRDDHGRWSDVGGFDMSGLAGVRHVEGTFGDLAMGVDDVGDVRFAFREGTENRELDLVPEDLGELRDALDRMATSRDDLAPDAESGEVYDDEWWGEGQSNKVELYGSGVISVIFGADEPDPYTLDLDPPDDTGGDDAQQLIDAIDGVLAVADDAERSRAPEQGATYTAPSAPKGGQFAVGGGRVGAKGKHKASPRRRAGTGGKPAAPAGPLHFDGKSGTGYGIKGGDPRVRTAQASINRLGITDSSGAALVLDGRYGPRTTSAVKKLQKALGLTPDGKMTPELLKQITELKQLPEKPAKAAPAKPRMRKPRTGPRPGTSAGATYGASSRSRSPSAEPDHVLDNGICATCGPAEPEHELDNGVCTTCKPAE